MIKAEKGGSMYDFVGDTHEAPQSKEREAGWQANRDDMSKPYVNQMPNHVKEAMTIEQKDHSYYEFDNLVFGRIPKDSFGQSVNMAFGELAEGFDFRAEKKRYIALYRKIMGDNHE